MWYAFKNLIHSKKNYESQFEKMGYYLVYGKRKNFWGEGFTEYGELIGFKADKFELVK